MITLRPYQERSISQIKQSFSRGSNGVVACLPVGAGKTLLTAVYVHELVSSGKNVLWVAHRDFLITQAAEAFHLIGFKDFVVSQTIPKGEVPSKLVICGIKKISLSDSLVNNPDLIVIDECHRAPSKTYLDSLARWKSKYLGLSATPERKGMSKIFDELLHPVHVSELIESGVSVKCNIVGSDIRTRVSFEDEDIERLGINWEPTKYFLEYGLGKSTICYTHNHKHSVKIIEQFKKYAKVDIVEVSAETPKKERERILREFKAGKIKYLVNCMLLTEGFDSDVDTIILTRACIDWNTYNQIAGRASRKSRIDKLFCTIVDLTGAYTDHGNPSDDKWFSLYAGSDKKPCLNCGADLARSDWLIRKDADCEWCQKTQGMHPHCKVCGFHYEIPESGRSEGLKPHQKKKFPESTVDLVDAILTRAPSMVKSARAIDEQLKNAYTRDAAAAWQKRNVEKDNEITRKCTYFALIALRERINEDRIKKRMPAYRERWCACVFNSWYGSFPPNSWDKEVQR
jgi:superfamily II DNA or RNA helicase